MRGEEVVLTVSEGKRLIARGLLAWEPFRRARESGVVAVAKGTTNSYVVEELFKDFSGEPVELESRPPTVRSLQAASPTAAAHNKAHPWNARSSERVVGMRGLDKTRYVTGNTRPATGGSAKVVSADMPDLVIRKGEVVEGTSAVEAAAEMGAGDIFLKGANAIQYNLGQAAVLIGHPTGGTMGAALGTIIARKVRLVSPVGLEKNVPIDLVDAAAAVREAGASPALWVVPAELFTEIEAIDALSGAEAIPVAAGGIGGAEGSVRLLITGADDEVEKALEAVKAVHGEPAFLG